MSESLPELWRLGLSLLEPCQLAAQGIVDIYQSQQSPKVTMKSDETPVTEADHYSHELLLAHLSTLTPDIPILSEEGRVPDYKKRQQWSRYWLVDPLDGTREFINRTGEFTINIALIVDGVARLGLVAVPMEKAFYLGVPDFKAVCFSEGGQRDLSVNPVRQGELRVLVGGRHRNQALKDCYRQLEAHFGSTESLKAGSALKFCRLAEGKGDIYPRFARCCEWDTAAGQALVEAAGGQVLDTHFQPLRYNRQESLISPHFYALGDTSQPWQGILHSED